MEYASSLNKELERQTRWGTGNNLYIYSKRFTLELRLSYRLVNDFFSALSSTAKANSEKQTPLNPSPFTINKDHQPHLIKTMM